MKHLKNFKLFENKKFKGYEVIDLKYDAPSYKTKPEEQKKFIKNNVEKLQDKAKIYKVYLNLMNALASDNQKMDKKIEGYVITVYNEHTNINSVYCGHFDDKMLGYIHINLTTYGKFDDIKYNKTFGKAVVFKHKKDAEKVKNEIKDIPEYYYMKFKIRKITLSQGYYY